MELILLRRATLAILVLFFVSNPAWSQSAPQMPAARFDSNSKGAQFYVNADGTLAMRVSHDLANRKVRIKHHYFYDVPARRAQTLETIESTPYWPTCTMPFANGKFLVGGKSPRTGNTILELWTATPPIAPVIGAAGQSTEFKAGSISDKRELYNATAAGRDIVTRLQPMLVQQGQPTHVLVQFDDSRDIYALDVAQETMVLVASPTSHPNCLTVSLLARDLVSQIRHHQNQGYLYIYSKSGAPDSETSIAILRDTNMDSVIDGLSTYTLPQYRAAGYSDPSVWLD